MDAEQAMTREVLLVQPDLGLDVAHRIMRRHRIRHLLVARGGSLIGVLSDRDVLVRARSGPTGDVVVPSVPVREAMTPGPVTCEPGVPVSTLARMMVELKIDAIPVVRAGCVVGLVTSTDLLLLLTDRTTIETMPFKFELANASEDDWLSDGGAGS
jgi:acetoin utilization protein AcuB